MRSGQEENRQITTGREGAVGVGTAMTAILKFSLLGSSLLESSFRDLFCAWRNRGLAALLVLAAATAGAQAQNVVAFVNGEPITQLDVEQRSKLIEASTHKAPSRQEILEELINEKLEIREAKRWGIEASNEDVDQAFTGAAQRAGGMTTDQFIQALTKAGVTPQTYRARLRAQIVWPALVRGRYQSSLEVFDKDVLVEKPPEGTTNYDYTLRPVLFIVPPGSPASAFEDRKREAEGLRGRFTSCDQGIKCISGLNGVIAQPQIVRSSADIPPEARKALDSVPFGQLTAPDITKNGVEMFAVCGKDPSKADNSPDKKQAREALFNQKFEQQSKRYLQQLRRQALIEYPSSGNSK